MPEIRPPELEYNQALRQLFDAVVAQSVLGGDSNPQEWLEHISHSLAQVGAAAELAGRPEILHAAVELEQMAARARRGETDRNDFESALSTGLSKMEKALDGDPPPAPATAGTAARPSAALNQDRELVSDFVLESREHLISIESQLLALEQNPANADALHSIFRGFHTIKGLAGFLEFVAIREVSHEVETVLDRARNGALAMTPAVIDVVLAGADYLKGEVGRVERGLQGNAEEPADHHALVQMVRSLVDQSGSADVGQSLKTLSQAMTNGETEPASLPQENKGDKRTAAAGSETRAVKVDTGKLDYLVDMVGEMVIAESMVRHNPELAGIDNRRLLRSLAQLGRITNEVQKTAMSMRMVQVGQLFQKMARLVRDLSRKHGKQVDFETSGEDTELDRNIVEELADPLMHMVRNAIDHGIETPEERRAAGKAPNARVTLRAFHQAGHISIEVSDDGRGLNRDKIVAKAREKGLIDSADHLSENEIFNLIFEPGFSTADQVTDISGRGVGMDVVRKKIQQLRGRVEIQSSWGRGSTFLLKLPLTLAIIDGLVVGVGNERYIVPLFAVREMLRPTAETISTVENRDEMALVRGRLFPVVRLYRRFRVVPRSEEPTESVLIIAESAGKDFCLMVDQVIGKQEVVIKSLGETMRNIAGVAGGAILGDGRVGLILDMEGVFGRTALG